MPLINLDAVLNPLPELKDHILDYIPRATTSEFGIVALGSGINVDIFGRIYLDTQEYSDRLTAIETTTASTLETTVNTLETKADELAASITQKLGTPNGIATLDSAGSIPSSQLPSYVDDVLEYSDIASFPVTGETGKIYVEITGNTTYRWGGTTYVKITAGEVSSVAGKKGIVTLTKDDVGLSNVDNTNDLDKPLSTATQTALTALENKGKRGIINLYDTSLIYGLNERVVLANGDIVKSTIDGNTNDPNVDMTGWVKTNSASQIFDKSGLSQQDVNDSSKLLSANVLDFFTESELMAWKADPNAFDASDAIIRVQTLSSGAEITFPTGTFRITKKIPSPKHWVGVYGGYDPHGTLIKVDNATAINGVIDVTGNSTDIKLQGIFFKGVQNRLHTLYKSKNGYIVRHKSLRVDSFAYGFVSKGTYDFFDDCHFNGNAVAIKPVASNATNQSTMFGYRNCMFTYNAKAFDVSQTNGFGSYEDWMNILFESCGFEANEYGIYAPQRMWYVTLLNCWFEGNSAYGLYCPTSHVLEVNTRHNANSPRLVDETNTSVLFGMIASLVDLEIKGHVLSDVKFPSEYSPTGAAAKGKTISQRFTDDGGGVVAEIAFVREKNAGNYGGSGIEFSTSQSTLNQTLVPRWGVNQFGSLYPKQDILYNIGSATKRCNTVYTAKVMYTGTVGDFFGDGSPEGVITASVGSTYRRIDGTAGQPTFYTKATGLGSTGWKAVTVVA